MNFGKTNILRQTTTGMYFCLKKLSIFSDFHIFGSVSLVLFYQCIELTSEPFTSLLDFQCIVRSVPRENKRNPPYSVRKHILQCITCTVHDVKAAEDYSAHMLFKAYYLDKSDSRGLLHVQFYVVLTLLRST